MKNLGDANISYFPFSNRKEEQLAQPQKGNDVEVLEPQGVVTERVFLDVSINGGLSERLIIGLYGEDCPLTVANFSKLCEGCEVQGKKLHYLNSTFHRIIPSFMAQGGDFTHFDGTGGQSKLFWFINYFL